MLISSAFAADQAAAAPQNPMMGFLFPIVLLAAFYFFILRPQMKASKEAKQIQDALQKGDEVLTQSGQLGKVVKVSDQYITLDIGGGATSLFQRNVVKTILPKGTIKDL